MTSFISYEQMKLAYNDFKKNLPQDKFDRYYTEFSFMKTLIEFAKKQGLEKDVFEYKKVQKDAAQNLIDMGYTVKLDD